jgi:hypothetical protein
MTTQTPASTASTDEAISATPVSVGGSAAPTSAPNATQEAKQQEEQWRIPQLLTALVTPILGLISVIFNLSGFNIYANIAGVLAIVTGATAALIAVAMWRSDRAATGQS